MTIRLVTLLCASFLSASAFGGIFGNTIGPDNGTCTAALPPDGYTQLLSGAENIIQFSFNRNDQLRATCLMPGFSIWEDCCRNPDAEPPARAVNYDASDYDDDVTTSCRFISADLGLDLSTMDYHVTVTPAGKVRLSCTFDLNGN